MGKNTIFTLSLSDMPRSHRAALAGFSFQLFSTKRLAMVGFLPLVPFSLHRKEQCR
jgi:hypothetical protein